VPDEDRRAVQGPDDLLEVPADLPDALAGENVGIAAGGCDVGRIVGPVGGDCGEAALLEEVPPRLPARPEQPQSVDEHDRRATGLVGAVDFLSLSGGDRAHRPAPDDVERTFVLQ
jgi:hypothetical protein